MGGSGKRPTAPGDNGQGGDSQPQQPAQPHSRSALLSAAAITATSLSLADSTATSNSSSTLEGGFLPYVGDEDGEQHEACMAGLTATALCENSSAEHLCCAPTAKWASREALLQPQPLPELLA